MLDQTIPVSQITVDPDLQPRVWGLNADHVKVLEQCGDAWPPLLVVRRDGHYVLVDGAHRFAAAQNLGLESVRVIELPAPDDGDLARLAFEANQQHGLPLTLADRRARAEKLLTQQPHVSNLEVARQVALAPTTVATIRQKLEDGATITPAPQRVGKGGTMYTVAAPDSARTLGQLPPAELQSPFAVVAGLFTSDERKAQRQTAGYLKRLAFALDDQYALHGWETAEDAAAACRTVLGDDAASELGERLGDASSNVFDVARALGYTG